MKKMLCLLAATAVLCAGIFKLGTNPLNQPVAVQTVNLHYATMVRNVNCSGKVMPIEDSKILSPGQYYVEEIYVREGQRVEKGQEIAKIVPIQSKLPVTSDFEEFYNQLNSLDLSDFPVLSDAYSYAGELLEKGGAEVTNFLGNTPKLFTEKPQEQNLISPKEGVITSLNLEAGQYVLKNQTLYSIGAETGFEIRVDISEGDAQKVAVGKNAQITLDAFPGQTFSGYVSYVAPKARQKLSGTSLRTILEAKISFDNPPVNLKEGYSAQAEIISSVHTNTPLLPYEAITQNQSNQEIVYVVENGRAVPRTITTGAEFNEDVQIVKGVGADDAVILYPDDGIREFQKVKQ